MMLISILIYTCSGQLIPCASFQSYREMLWENSPWSLHTANTDKAWKSFSDPYYDLRLLKCVGYIPGNF